MGVKLALPLQEHLKELQIITQKAGRPVSSETLTQMLFEIQSRCSWYPEEGSLALKDWDIIGKVLHTEPKAPVAVLKSWFICRYAINAIAPVFPLASLTCNVEAPLAYSQGVQLVLPKPIQSIVLCPPLASVPPVTSTIPLLSEAYTPLSLLPTDQLDKQQHSLPISESLSLADLPDKQQPPLSTSKSVLIDHLQNQISSLQDIKESSEILSMCPVNFTDNQKTTGTTIIEIKATSYPIVTDLNKRKALMLVPEPLQNLSSLRPKASQPSLEFINKLQVILKRQIDSGEAPVELLHKLIGLGNNPSLSDMLKACQDVGNQANLASVIQQGNKPRTCLWAV